MAASKSSRDSNSMFSGLDLGHKDPKPIEIPIENEVPEKPKAPKEPKEKKTSGRPRKFIKGKTKFINVQLYEDEIFFLEKNCGIYGGKTGYIRHLINEEKRRQEKR